MKIAQLEYKVWYRFLKVIYIGIYFSFILIILLFASSSVPRTSKYGPSGDWGFTFGSLVVGLGIVFITMEVVRRIFFYIVIDPEKSHLIEENNKKI